MRKVSFAFVAVVIFIIFAVCVSDASPPSSKFNGGTLSKKLVLDETGIEGQATDDITDCSSFASTNGGIFYDDSEGKWKKCQDGSLTDLDTTGSGSLGINLSSSSNDITTDNDVLQLIGTAEDLDIEFGTDSIDITTDTGVTEIDFIGITIKDDGVALQTVDTELTALAGLTSASNKMPYFTGSGTADVADLSAFARTILDDAAATNVRTTLGLVIGTDVLAPDGSGASLTDIDAATGDSATAFFDAGAIETNYGGTGTDLSSVTGIMGMNAGSYVDIDTAAELETYAGLGAFANEYLDDADASTMRTTLGLVIDTDVEPKVTEGSLDDSTVITDDIKDNTITTSDLSAALTFADGDQIDLSGITYVNSATTNEGLALPAYVVGAAPADNKNYIAYDASNNAIMIYESGGWVDTSSGSGASTSLNFVTTQAEGTLTSESVLTEGDAIDITDEGGDGSAVVVGFDATELDAVTWSDGANASNTWTFNVSGTDHTMVAGDGVMTFGDAVTITDTLTASNGIALGTSKSITGTTGLTVGGGTETIAIDSSDWDIDATGVVTGIGNVTSDGVITSTGFTIGSAAVTEAEFEIIDGATLSTSDINIIDGISDSGSLTAAEILYVDGVTSSIQTQLDARCLESVFGTSLESDDLELNGTTLQLAAEIPHIDAAADISGEWETQDDIALAIGNDRDWTVIYDESTSNRLEFTHTAGPDANVYFDLNDDAADSTFTITNTDLTYYANLSVEGLGTFGSGLMLTNDGSSAITLTNNTSYTGSGYQLFYEGGNLVSVENSSEKTVLNDSDGATLTGTSWDFGSVTNFKIATGNSATADAEGELAIDTDDDQFKMYVGGAAISFDFTSDAAGYILKSDGAGGFTMQADATGGTPTWDSVSDPAGDATIDHDAGEETSFTFTGDYTTGPQFLVQQLTGNPSGGTLMEIRGADSDSGVLEVGDGTNVWTVSTAGLLTNAGTATLNLAAASDLTVGGGQIDYDDMAGSGNISTSGTATVETVIANLVDATGAADIDYGSADVIDHTFVSDGGTVIIDGSITSIGNDLGSASAEWNDLFLNDGGQIQLGDDQDVTITHVADTGFLLELDDSIMFGDAAVFIESDNDGYLDLDADVGIRLNSAVRIGAAADSNRRLHIAESDTSLAPVSADTSMILEENDNTWFEMQTPNTKYAGILFSDGSLGGYIAYDHGTTLNGTSGLHFSGTGSGIQMTIDTSGDIVATGSMTVNSLLSGLFDATGAVDMDYGSADITDHTFTTDGGTVIIDGQSISDNHLLSVDDASAADGEIAVFTANGIEGATLISISDSGNQFYDNTDTTKKYQMVLDNVSTSTTRTCDVGDYNGQIPAATDVDSAGHIKPDVQTDTSGAITIQVNSVNYGTDTGDADIPDGACDDAADVGNWVVLISSAADQYSLTSNDASNIFILDDLTNLDAGDELDIDGSMVSVMCIAAEYWKVTGYIDTAPTDGGVAD